MERVGSSRSMGGTPSRFETVPTTSAPASNAPLAIRAWLPPSGVSLRKTGTDTAPFTAFTTSMATCSWEPMEAPVLGPPVASPVSSTLKDMLGQHMLSSMTWAPASSHCLAILAQPATPSSPAYVMLA